MVQQVSRRDLIAATAAGFTGASLPLSSFSAEPRSEKEPFGYCLNTSTIRGQKLPVPEQIRVAAQAGYTGLEPWIDDLRNFAESGGNLGDIKKQLEDAGISVESAIGFAEWIVDDDAQRARGLENAKRDMELVRQIGGKRIAAPPSGATKQPNLNLSRAAERYRTLIAAGREIGVIPELELWGFSQSLSKLSELLYVAIECNDPDACLLPDVYHLYKGGSDFTGLRLVYGAKIPVLHMNDYPGKPDRANITDADRIYPGDGIAPLNTILRDLYDVGFRGMLSLEVFNRQYWQQEAAAVARIGIEKMRAAVRSALA